MRVLGEVGGDERVRGASPDRPARSGKVVTLIFCVCARQQPLLAGRKGASFVLAVNDNCVQSRVELPANCVSAFGILAACCCLGSELSRVPEMSRPKAFVGIKYEISLLCLAMHAPGASFPVWSPSMRKVGYTCSAGIGCSKLAAKMAGELHKPHQQTTILPQ